MKQLKRILLRMLRPGTFWSIPIAMIGTGLLVFVFVSGFENTLFGIITYPISLYAMMVLGFGIPDISKTAKALISKNKIGALYINDRVLRARISLYQGLGINLIFTIFYLLSGLYYSSFWFGAVAVYYIILTTMRFILLRTVRKTTGNENQSAMFLQELRTYRFCGYLMIILNSAMTGMVFQMIWHNKGYEYPGLIIYVTAFYTFYCMVTAVINMVKFRKMDSPVLSAAKMLSFTGALMSMLTLQTAMITQFGAGEDESFRQIMNTTTGGAICLIVFCMAIFMIVRANCELKKLQINNIQT